jgi:hypothetical protein
MTAADYVALGVLIVLIPLLLRRTFGSGESGAKQDDENPKD